MIKEIQTINNSAILEELKQFPNQAIIWEILEKNKSGKIFELSKEAILILENCNDPFVFLVGTLTAQSIETVISFLKDLKFPMVYCNPKYHPFFLDKGWNFNFRVELQFNKFQKFEKAEFATIDVIDTLSLFKKCFWYKGRSELYGSDENFLKYGTGYALCFNDQILTEAYLSIGGGFAEIGIITHPDHRGKGYASQILSHLIKKCLEANLIPIWSCHTHNRTSLNTGFKLGFIPNFYYVQMVPPKSEKV